MNKMIHNFRMRRRAQKVIEIGLGPFTPDYFKAFSECRCQNCAKPIPETSLLGNALVVQHKSILVLCSECRTGKKFILSPNHPFRASPRSAEGNNTVDRTVLIGEMDWLISKGGCNFSYHDFLLCLRHRFGRFQKYGRHPFSGYSIEALQAAKHRFGRPLPGSCGECGALWINEWEMSQKNKDEILHDRRYSDVKCWACGFLHLDQWFLRKALNEETHCLIGEH